MKVKCALMAAVFCCAASLATADVIPLGPFTGDMSEGFESIGAPGSYPELPLFDGHATLDDTLSGIAVIAYNWTGTGGTLLPYAGAYFGGTPTGSQTLVVHEPVLQFGGYISTVSDVPGARAVFRDVDGETIATLDATIMPVTWGWQGWSSDTPIGSIEFTGNGPFGNRPIQFDNLEVTFVPEPASLGLIAVGAALLLRRRR
jgi:hypothetical protein